MCMYAHSATPPEISINTTRRSATSGDRHPSFILEITSVYFLSVLFTSVLLPRILVLSMIIIASGDSIDMRLRNYQLLTSFRRSFVIFLLISLMTTVKLTATLRNEKKKFIRIYSSARLFAILFIFFPHSTTILFRWIKL